MSKLVFYVPRGRRFCGRAFVLGADGGTRAGPYRALAMASVRVAKKHGNVDASPLLPFGHPPAGTYVIAASLPPGYVHVKRKRRYGKVGGLLLAPQSGDALAATTNGRKLVALHGGPQDKKRRLRPTRGGIRLSNAHMRALLEAVNDAQRAGDPVASVELLEIDLAAPRGRDKKGGRRLRPRKSKTSSGATPGVTSMLLLPFALGEAGKKSVGRRKLLAAAAVALGALAVQACERPSHCSPLACPLDDGGDEDADAGAGIPDGGRTRFGDAGCTPEGYVCGGGEG